MLPLLSFGHEAKVMKPKWLIKRIEDKVRAMNNAYQAA